MVPMDFMVGIECTQIVRTDDDAHPEMHELEEFELMRHYTMWRQDFDLIAKLRTDKRRVTKVRWAIPWYRVETAPGVYDWSWTDEAIDYANGLGLELVVDIVHYGCPRWMPKAFLDPQFPERVESFTRACVERYKGKVRHWTPLNEPAVTALFCGERGEWPPYRTDAAVEILVACAIGMQRQVRAIREIDPDALIWAAEAMKNYHPINEEAKPWAQAALRRDLVVWDLVHGKVDDNHACRDWLVAGGATEEQLALLRGNAVRMDILGINFYPWGSQTYEVKDGVLHQFWEWNGTLMIELLRGCYEYTGATLYVTETSAHGGGGAKSESVLTNAGDFRIRWMDETMWAMEQARREGIPALGYTQFPLFTMIDWKYRLEGGKPEDYFVNFGMVEVDPETYERKWTAVSDRFLFHMREFEKDVEFDGAAA